MRLFLRTTLVIGGSFQSTLKNCQALALVLKKHTGEKSVALDARAHAPGSRDAYHADTCACWGKK